MFLLKRDEGMKYSHIACRVTLLLLVILAAPCLAQERMPLGQVRNFMYQLQNLENPAALEALAKSDYDLLVVEPTATVKDNQDFDVKGMVRRLHAGKP